MIRDIRDCVRLQNGVEMPWLGLGLWRTRAGEELERAVGWALEAGYRSFDTASIYANEESLGAALRASGLPREELFVTTKLWCADEGFEPALRAFDESLARLGLDQVDLYLIHWPRKETMIETWRALERVHREGRARAIGVSNFLVHHLEALLARCEIAPMVDQVELHPRLVQPELRAFCKTRGIQLEAWAPLMKGRLDSVPELAATARRYGKTPAQLALRWALQRGVVAIPKSVHRERIRENARIFDVEISPEDMAALGALDRGERVGPHPDHFVF